MKEQVGDNKPDNAIGISDVSDLEISTWHQSVANHRRPEGTSRNLKSAVVAAIPRDNNVPEQKQQEKK